VLAEVRVARIVDAVGRDRSGSRVRDRYEAEGVRECPDADVAEGSPPSTLTVSHAANRLSDQPAPPEARRSGISTGSSAGVSGSLANRQALWSSNSARSSRLCRPWPAQRPTNRPRIGAPAR